MSLIARSLARFVNDKPTADNISMRMISFLIVIAVGGLAPAADLRIGSAAIVITPPLGTPLAGYYETRISDAVHDDLYAKALVIECGGNRAAMVSCDLISMPITVAAEARKIIEQQTGLKPDQVKISATHAHTGPILPGRTARETSDGPGGDLAQEYVQQLPGLIAASVKQAIDKLAPATASAAIGREDRLSVNRRYINHVNVNTKDPQKGFDEARRIGTVLAGEVIKTYARLKPINPDAIRFKREVVKIELPKFTPEDLLKARQTAVKFGKNAPTFL